jgi:hypothetical protein
MADDDWRVEARLNLLGRGSGTTPERIKELEARAKELDKLNKKPSTAFGALIKAEPAPTNAKPPARKMKERKLTATPKPGLVHPKQRDTFGREDEDDVILKG